MLSVGATGDNLTYQWYQGTAGVTTTPVGNEASVTFYPYTTKSYWVRVSGTCGSIDSNVVLVSVRPRITQYPKNIETCKGMTVTVSVTAPLKTAPTIESISDLYYNSSYRQLRVNLNSADYPYASYAWYQGALGTTTAQVGWDRTLLKPHGSTTPCWVRVTRSDTGCWSDKAAQ